MSIWSDAATCRSAAAAASTARGSICAREAQPLVGNMLTRGECAFDARARARTSSGGAEGPLWGVSIPVVDVRKSTAVPYGAVNVYMYMYMCMLYMCMYMCMYLVCLLCV